MSYQPDILVTSPGDPGVHLVVEAKLEGNSSAAESALKRYMSEARIPTGILVTPLKVSVFRDTFLGPTEDSIQYVGGSETLRIPELQPFATGQNKDPIAFEEAVQEWLVQLRYRQAHGFLRNGDQAVLIEHVGPALLMGEVRAAGPRLRTSAA